MISVCRLHRLRWWSSTRPTGGRCTTGGHVRWLWARPRRPRNCTGPDGEHTTRSSRDRPADPPPSPLETISSTPPAKRLLPKLPASVLCSWADLPAWGVVVQAVPACRAGLRQRPLQPGRPVQSRSQARGQRTPHLGTMLGVCVCVRVSVRCGRGCGYGYGCLCGSLVGGCVWVGRLRGVCACVGGGGAAANLTWVVCVAGQEAHHHFAAAFRLSPNDAEAAVRMRPPAPCSPFLCTTTGRPALTSRAIYSPRSPGSAGFTGASAPLCPPLSLLLVGPSHKPAPPPAPGSPSFIGDLSTERLTCARPPPQDYVGVTLARMERCVLSRAGGGRGG